jgi:hypothetical protein
VVRRVLTGAYGGGFGAQQAEALVAGVVLLEMEPQHGWSSGTAGQGYAGGANAGTNLQCLNGGGGGAGAVKRKCCGLYFTGTAGNGGEGVFSDITGSFTVQRAVAVVGVV